MRKITVFTLTILSFVVLSAFMSDKKVSITKNDDSAIVITLNLKPVKDSITEPLVTANINDSLSKNTTTEPLVETNNQVVEETTEEVAPKTTKKNIKSCKVSYYGKQFHGRKTANGEKFDMNALTAAHKTMKFGTKVKITNPNNGKSVIVKINDRGPYIKSRTFDLSYGAFKEIANPNQGTLNVQYEILN